MNTADKAIAEILKRYGEDFASNTWVVPGGKARAIQHKCIERMAVEAGITFAPPVMVRSDVDMCVMIVTGHMPVKDGEIRSEWSVGEAAPKNNKNAYPYSMAEKRGKDRVALKLIGLHGLLYSEEEAEDFRQQSGSRQQEEDRGPQPMSVDHMLHEIGSCAGDAGALAGLKTDPSFRAGYRAADELSRKRIEQALTAAAEECAA